MIKKAFAVAFIVCLCQAGNAELEFKLDTSIKESLKDIKVLPAVRQKPSVLPSTISGIDIKGNNRISSDRILEAVKSRIGDSLSQEKVAMDIKAISSLGLFEDVRSDFIKEKAGTRLVFTIKENPVIKDITFEGTTVYKKEQLTSVMVSKQGQMLNFKNVQEDIKAIEELYHKDGYILQRVVDVVTDPKTGVLKVKMVEGVVEAIAIDGNDVTREYVITRELRTKPGTVLNEKVLSKDLRRVFNLGFFSNVTPNFDAGSEADKVILILNVKESKTNTINFGGGYGEREGWFGFVDLAAENLFGTGQGAMLRGQAGQTQSTYQLRYTYPWLFPEKLGERVSFTVRRWLTEGKNVYLLETPEREGRYNGWDFSLSKPLNDEWNASVTVGTERVTPTGTATFEPYDQTTVALSAAFDTRDNWMNPTTGKYYVFAYKQGWKYASVQTDFGKASVDFNQFLKLAENHVLAGHLGGGLGVGDVPVGEIYYVGGANTVRGYEPSQAKIGKRKVLLNIEYRLTFNDMFQGVLFFDSGDAWNDGGFVPSNFISGKGFGIRLNTPMGPIRLDYGIGDHRTFGEGVLHFSIGHAF
ncbi:MAG: BamA/TamA family outer membrane protein [Candidatus Margulisiibacteriota bacterium]